MYSVRRGQVDAVRRSGGAFSLSQQLRGAGKLRAALEADLSFAANRNAAHAFRFLINLIFHYSWPEHVERFKAEALAQKQEELRARFRQVPNVVRQKRWSLLYCSYTAVDYAEKLCMYCAENKVHLGILAAETNHPFCRILHCRVRRWEVKRFLKAAERLKEDSIKAADAGYVTACEERKGNLFKKTGRC